MSLVLSTLREGIKALSDTTPKTIDEAAQRWASAVFNYSAGGIASPLTTLTLNLALLQSSFKSSMSSQSFMDNLGTNLQAFWLAAIWAGPSFTGVTTSAVGAQLNSSQLGKTLAVPGNSLDMPSFLASEIDKWTKTIMVTATNTVSGATSVVPVI